MLAKVICETRLSGDPAMDVLDYILTASREPVGHCRRHRSTGRGIDEPVDRS